MFPTSSPGLFSPKMDIMLPVPAASMTYRYTARIFYFKLDKSKSICVLGSIAVGQSMIILVCVQHWIPFCKKRIGDPF